MTGLKLQFATGGARIDFDEPVSGFFCEIQNALVNCGTERGSDPIFPNRGTDLGKPEFLGSLINFMDAAHQANFAAMDTLFFLKEVASETNVHEISEMLLDPVGLREGQLLLTAGFTSRTGQRINVLDKPV